MAAHAVNSILPPPSSHVSARPKTLTPQGDHIAASVAVARACRATGTSWRDLAAASGVSLAYVGRWMDACDKAVPNLKHMLRWPVVLRAAMAEELAGGSRGAECLTGAVLGLGKELGDVQAEYARALADGNIDRDEAKSIAVQAGELERLARSVRLGAERLVG